MKISVIKRKIKLFFQTFEYLLKIILFSNFKSKRQLLNISKRKQNTKIRILGNGNSLKQGGFIDRAYDYMVLNNYFLSESYYEVKPLYYLVADPYYFLLEEGIDKIKKVISITNWEMYLFIPYNKGKNSFFKKMETNYVKICLYNSSPFEGFTSIKQFFFDKMLAMPIVQNVLVGGIMVSIWLNYKIIELYGVEHSWLSLISVDKDNNVLIQDKHFYEKEEEVKKTIFKVYQDTSKLHEALYAFARMFESYWEINDYIKGKDINIINKSPNSFIDAFKKD
ncbi:hypothetical protein [Capnocytophaga sputigena]|jgi:hypothetical protein